MKIKRKNGVFRGFDFGPKKEMTPEQKRNMHAASKENIPARPGPLHGLRVDTKPNPRKNGVYQAPTVATISNTNSRKKAAEKAAQRRTSVDSVARDYERKAQAGKTAQYEQKQYSKIKEEQKARGGKDKGVVGDTERAYRISKKQYKGKYWGPDEFKGDLNKVREWEKAGRPKDRSAFMKAANRRTSSKGD